MGWRLILICYHLRYIGVVYELEPTCRRCEFVRVLNLRCQLTMECFPFRTGMNWSGEEHSRELEVP